MLTIVCCTNLSPGLSEQNTAISVSLHQRQALCWPSVLVLRGGQVAHVAAHHPSLLFSLIAHCAGTASLLLR
jgi:hypothetical protein